ncbi:helix-turn-helix domain-containing protein [Kitasatospora sp. NPDC004240]
MDDALARTGLSKTQLAARAGVSRGTIHNAFTGPVPTATTVAALARALRLDMDTLLELRRVAAGIPDPAAAPKPSSDKPTATISAAPVPMRVGDVPPPATAFQPARTCVRRSTGCVR